jgi:hypothetical protein
VAGAGLAGHAHRLDKLTGGAGLLRGRRHPGIQAAGEVVNWWRVARIDRGNSSACGHLSGHVAEHLHGRPETHHDGSRFQHEASIPVGWGSKKRFDPESLEDPWH